MDNSMNRRLSRIRNAARDSSSDVTKNKQIYDVRKSPQSSSPFRTRTDTPNSCSTPHTLSRIRNAARDSSSDVTKNKQIYDVRKSPQSSSPFRTRTDTPNSCSTPHTGVSKFSANDRLNKYRTKLENRKNEVVKVHHGWTSPKSRNSKCKGISVNVDRKPSTSLPLESKRPEYKAGYVDLNKKSSTLLGKRKESDDVRSGDNEMGNKKQKVGNNRNNTINRNVLTRNIAQNIKESKLNTKKVETVYNYDIIDKPCSSEDDYDMDWSPIDQNEVVLNIQQFRDLRKNNVFELQNISPCNANTSIVLNNVQDKTYIVVDTNIFISHLNILRDMLSKKYDIDHIVYVPWIVMQELDYFKDGRSGSPAMLKSARRAVKFINDNLIQQHTRLKGQTVKEALCQKQSSSNPDDNILFCCIQLAQTSNTVILLSNDINLRNKALINDITSYGTKEILTKINDLNVNSENKQKIHQVNYFLSDMCTEIILTEMKEAYGSVLDRLIKEPPWDLKQCLTYIKRFWSPVFSLIITQKQCLKVVEDLLELIQSCDDVISEENTEEFIKLCLSMCVYFKNCLHKHQRNVESSIEKIKKILC